MIISQTFKSFEGFYCEQHNLSWLGIGIEFEIALTDERELNFDKSFLTFNVKKKIYAKVTLNLTVNIEN